jgi:hypothetical protein
MKPRARAIAPLPHEHVSLHLPNTGIETTDQTAAESGLSMRV